MEKQSGSSVQHIERKYKRLKRQIFLRRLRASLPFYLAFLLLIGGFALFLTARDRTRKIDSAAAAAEVRVWVLDVGQGDAILIESQGHAALIDAGEADQGQRVVQMLRSLGVSRLDYVINSHPHSDHSGGLRTVLNQIPAERFFLPRVPDALIPTGYGYAQMLKTAEQKGIAV
ncbi:MAG: MBL fold metallo-hydrolase, partial [Oscillospiraceae bacterium]|nr:MBL fold metallo-hydrolase [Oscillospiraceae bacterium]